MTIPMNKYIRLEDDRMIIFPVELQHSHVAEQQALSVISAGFIHPQRLICFGESISLGIGGLPDDTEILRRLGQEQDAA